MIARQFAAPKIGTKKILSRALSPATLPNPRRHRNCARKRRFPFFRETPPQAFKPHFAQLRQHSQIIVWAQQQQQQQPYAMLL
jgi:hypothetical protein